MATPVYNWTAPIPVARRRSDPSGIQDAGTEWQAKLLPGLTTQTTNVRYISLFTAARYLRMMGGENKPNNASLGDFWRRLEALIAVCSVIHHQDNDDPPSGIIGKNWADRSANQSLISLKTGLQNPPYSIYRGTLGALNLFNLHEHSHPLEPDAEQLARAWNPTNAGKIGKLMQTGNLEYSIKRSDLAQISNAFCLCIPNGSPEQQELINLLFGLKRRDECPQFSEEGIAGSGIRVASWRLLLEIVVASPDRPLWGEHLMGRILENDMLDLSLAKPLQETLLIWRWIASRSFYERGWTILFNNTFKILRGERDGLSRESLCILMNNRYTSNHPNDDLNKLIRTVKSNLRSGDWYVERFQRSQPMDCLQMMVAGLLATEADRNSLDSSILKALYKSGAISFASEQKRLSIALEGHLKAGDFWGGTSIETLVHHVRISLHKIRQGNPDTLHVDFERGRWIVPAKALGWNPLPSSASSRLDVAIGWGEQLGLLTRNELGALKLTLLGQRVRHRWDEVYKEWE
jgi:hypothetical protein